MKLKLTIILSLLCAVISMPVLAEKSTTSKPHAKKHPCLPHTPRPNTDPAVLIMVPISSGSFNMGSKGDIDAQPLHPVTVPAFEMSMTEVTQGQWKAVMGKHNNPSKFKGCGDSCPVDSVSYDMAQDFILKLNQKTKKHYRLPTEAEWEYACRAGGSALYCGGNEIDQLAWYEGNSGNKSLPFERRVSDTCHLDYGGGYSLPVALRKPNAWGLYDMSGNLAEWVQDNAHYNYAGAPADGSAWNTPDTGDFSSYRVLRGGSWNSGARYTGATYRNFVDSTIVSADIGFRVVRSLP